ncbi:DUF6520 family protein [Zunongwangia atlantica]|uniref:Secreted protein n=1 Tax=Zunongwangia atlantica 22II14-10F7 TaxID=1185767 RepID=A0A1Y1T6T3_9FLAO|nr:DUF6520 family protein [Zunongwangia atlantica]ORL46133.1 hypothetical protein IIF7_06166 [Zunongwangia atlantica 22II14-10F7]
MKRSKLILPLMAFICAIGMSFTTAQYSQEEHDYVDLGNGSWFEIDEVDCGEGSEECRVQIGEDGPIYQVYDEQDNTTSKQGDSDEPIVIDPS